MADEAPRPEDVEGAKSKGWSKFRGKIFDKDSKLSSKFKRQHDHQPNDQDVDDFDAWLVPDEE